MKEKCKILVKGEPVRHKTPDYIVTLVLGNPFTYSSRNHCVNSKKVRISTIICILQAFNIVTQKIDKLIVNKGQTTWVLPYKEKISVTRI